MNNPRLTRLFATATFATLVGCAHPGAPAPKPAPSAPATAKPAAPLPPAPGAAVTVSEAESGKTVRLGLGEKVAIRLRVNESTGNRWFLSNRLQGGVLVKKGNASYAPTPEGTVATVLYQAMRVGTQELHFSYAPPDARQNVARTADFRVVVH
jgi:predicted secreted protein